MSMVILSTDIIIAYIFWRLSSSSLLMAYSNFKRNFLIYIYIYPHPLCQTIILSLFSLRPPKLIFSYCFKHNHVILSIQSSKRAMMAMAQEFHFCIENINATWEAIVVCIPTICKALKNAYSGKKDAIMINYWVHT